MDKQKNRQADKQANRQIKIQQLLRQTESKETKLLQVDIELKRNWNCLTSSSIIRNELGPWPGIFYYISESVEPWLQIKHLLGPKPETL